MTQIESFITEFDQEAAITRRLLERLPDDNLGWKPHEKSAAIGTLAMHIATLPGRLAEAVTKDDYAFVRTPSENPASAKDVLEALDDSIGKFHHALRAIGDEKLDDRWTAKFGDTVVMDMKRRAVIRTALLNHWYHHRGQLSVYLRLLNIPVPSIYGPSADENPFA